MCEDYDFDEDSNYDFAEIEDGPQEPFCDFCGKTLSELQASGKTLVQGPRVYICESCNKKIAAEFGTNEEHKRHLLNLLAIIHRDGGHYVAEHGLDKAVQDAMKIVAESHD